MASCQKDEVIATGKLKVTFANQPTGVTFYISPAENTQISISGWLTTDNTGALVYELNMGNYMLYSAGSTYLSDIGFQIKSGATTVIYYDSNNTPHIE